MKRLHALHIGEEAIRLLAAVGKAVVMGSTSKGVFLATPGKDILFLSYESFRSPITIALGRADETLRLVEIGDEAGFESGRLTFPAHESAVDTTGLIPWEPQAPGREALPAGPRRERILQIAEGITSAKPDSGFSPLVSALILNRQPVRSAAELQDAAEAVAAVFAAAGKRDLFAALLAFEGLLGYGRGLTPSGDDFALGFLLAVNRWGEVLGWDSEAVDLFNDSLARMAIKKTTSLSAALIRLAAAGRGDERQIAVIDGIMCAELDVNACLQYTLEMGNSSGIDSFLGMAAGVL